MSIEIPVSFKDQSADFELSIDLDNIPVSIRLIYNIRVNYWFAIFTTENYNIQRVKLVSNFLILDQYKASIPEILGDFIVKRISDDLDKPDLTYENFGIDWGFFYLTVDEVQEWKENNNLS